MDKRANTSQSQAAQTKTLQDAKQKLNERENAVYSNAIGYGKREDAINYVKQNQKQLVDEGIDPSKVIDVINKTFGSPKSYDPNPPGAGVEYITQ